MKKSFFLGVVSLVLFTGCGTSKVTCTLEGSEPGRKIDTTINVTFKSDKVSVVDEVSVLTFEEDYKDSIDAVYDAINEGYEQYEDEDGIDIETKKDEDSITINIKIVPEKQKNSTDNIINVELSKEELIKELETEGYTCK